MFQLLPIRRIFPSKLFMMRRHGWQRIFFEILEAVMRKEYLEAGKIVSTHGVRGEMKVLPWADGPEFLTLFDRVYLSGKEYPVESVRIQKTCNLLKLQGVDTVEAAQALRNQTVLVLRSDVELEEGTAFIAELIGLPVYAGGKEIGRLREVLPMPGNDVYVVKGEKEYMIPAVKEFVQEINVEEGFLRVSLIEGMETDAN